MENLIIIIAMLYLCRSASDKRLLTLIAGSCGVLELVYRANIDIALYYGVCAMISVIAALIAVAEIETTSAKVFAVFMIMQALICLCLIPDWSFTTNELLQFMLSKYNVILVFILISIGISSDDRGRDNC